MSKRLLVRTHTHTPCTFLCLLFLGLELARGVSTATASCPPQWCWGEGDFVCVWNYDESDCNHEFLIAIGPCQCEANSTCTGVWVQQIAHKELVFEDTGLPRPEGPCIEIPCGVCYVKEYILCRAVVFCLNENLDSRCNPFSSQFVCLPGIKISFWGDYYVNCHQPCCLDQV